MFREMKKLLKTTGSGLQFLMLLFLRCPFDAAMTVVNAVFLQYSFNSVLNNDSGGLLNISLVFILCSFCLFLYNGTVRCFYAPFVVRMEAKLRRLLFRKIMKFPCEKIENYGQGDLLTRLNTDVQMPFSKPIHLPHAVCSIVNITVSSFILWNMNPAIFMLILAFVVPHIVFNQAFIAGAMPELNRKSLEATAVNTGEFSSIITCAETAVLYDGYDYLLKRFEKSSMRLFRANIKIRIRNAIGAGVMPLFGGCGYLVLLIFSAGRIAGTGFTFGDLTAAFQYRGGVLLGSMMFINSMISIQASMAGIKRINETMSEKSEETYG